MGIFFVLFLYLHFLFYWKCWIIAVFITILRIICIGTQLHSFSWRLCFKSRRGASFSHNQPSSFSLFQNLRKMFYLCTHFLFLQLDIKFLMEFSTLVRGATCLLAFQIHLPIFFASHKTILSFQFLHAIMVEVIDYW